MTITKIRTISTITTVIYSDPLIVWELSIPGYCLSVAIHACEWALVVILWRDNYFRLCCIIHASGMIMFARCE
jgi:hypothetical protein